MYIDLSQLEEDELRVEHQYTKQFDLHEHGVQLTSAPTIGLWLRRTAGRDVRVKGHLRAEVEVECDRCLGYVSLPMDVSFDVFYAPVEVLTPEEDVSLAPKDLAYGFYRDNLLDVDALVREQMLLALPFRCLCDPDCRGLCPSCGVDLNKEVCSCEQNIVAPYWSALRDLKKPQQ
jgi:uncharacterized protein